MKKIALGFVGLMMLSACVTTNASYENVSDTLRKVNVEEEGKVVFSHYEILDKKSSLWLEAEEKDDVWKLTANGKRKRKSITGQC